MSLRMIEIPETCELNAKKQTAMLYLILYTLCGDAYKDFIDNIE